MNSKDSFPGYLYGVKFQEHNAAVIIPVYYPTPGKLYRAAYKKLPLNNIPLFRSCLPHDGILRIPNGSIVMYIKPTEYNGHKVLYRDTIGLLLSEIKMEEIER